ncbi:MAG TPA: hypothetical protein VEI97_21035, partial [bacterium]|nr:hypothetical protein [bacterium]
TRMAPHGLVRFGVLDPARPSIDWRGWIALPQPVEPASLQPFLLDGGSRWHLIFSAAPPGGTSPGFSCWTTLDPLPGLALPPDGCLVGYPSQVGTPDHPRPTR